MKRFFLPALAVGLLMSGCGKAPPTQTSNNPELPLTGPEVWNVAGTNFNVEGTAALLLGNGQTLLVVKALCDFQANASHRPIGRALAKYAVDHGYQNRLASSSSSSSSSSPSSASALGARRPFSGSVGVALTQKRSIGSVSASTGYRYSFTVAELQDQTTITGGPK